jgi:hypothetical protein
MGTRAISAGKMLSAGEDTRGQRNTHSVLLDAAEVRHLPISIDLYANFVDGDRRVVSSRSWIPDLMSITSGS